MNSEKAKKIPLTALLDKIGACKIRTSNNDVWYLSPFRNEKSASFKVNTQKNLFYDFGEGLGGTILDFVIRYYQCDISEALKILDRDFDSFSFQQQPVSAINEKVNPKKNYEITTVQTLSNPVLMDYLKSRKLNLTLCKKYLCEVYYQMNGKNYFGVGFKNDQNGFEIRNKYVKICLGKKWFTHIKTESKSVVILESWSDFLSLMVLYPAIEKTNDFLILNSLTMLSSLDLIAEQYKQIYLALDRDEAGEKATENCLEKWKEKSVDLRYLYPNSKDINEFLSNKRTVKNNRTYKR